MNITELHVKKVEDFILSITGKYVKRPNIWEPLNNILGDFSKDLFLRAVRNIMFERINVPFQGRIVKIWLIKTWAGQLKGQEHITWLAKQIIQEEIDLKKMVWRKNKWARCNTFIDFDTFKNKCNPIILNHLSILSFFKVNELTEAIYKVIVNAYETGKKDESELGKRYVSEKTDKNLEIKKKNYLFITEDGVKIFKHDKCFAIDKKDSYVYEKLDDKEDAMFYDGNSKELIYFSTIEAYKDWFIRNSVNSCCRF